jgi:phage tail-like protein
MAVPRDNPYGAFNFRVTAERFGDAGTVQGGFQEVSGLGTEITMAEYRNGNSAENLVVKVPMLAKTSDVTLKRGVMGADAFFKWIKAVRDGDQNVRATVTIELFDEARQGPVMTWVLSRAVAMKYTGPTLSGKGTDVAMEELVLACEKLDVS